MTGRSDSYIKKVILSLLILSGLAVSVYSQDKKISGIVNVYKRVEAIGPGLDNVTLNTVDSIAPGDTVMLIQMQGITIQTPENLAYGTSLQDTIGKPGGYEFVLVDTVYPDTKKVFFKSNILNSFSTKGNVQLIRVPYYNSATVIGKLTARSWNSTEKVGGVLSMIVGRKLNLNADIDVSGTGLNGGKDTIGIGDCVNSLSNSMESYPATFTNSGYKGEGVATYDASKVLLNPLHAKGMGPNLTGGGGGNGKYAGGGGGGNRGKGGDGGEEINWGPLQCGTPLASMNGASTVKISYILDGLFLGGGGGASTHAVGSTGSSGANGGGIVIIIADTISGNRNSFKANGAASGDALGNAGAGGGGGGGSIAISVQSFSNVASDSLKISVIGGDGGINSGYSYGFGGGGGGGLIWFNAPDASSIPAKVPTKLVYGNPGPGTPSEGNGETKYSFSPILNGFLFNSILSEVTGNQVDSICSNVSFGTISGTLPVGGKAPHTYLWESSITSEASGFDTVPGVYNLQNYIPGILTQTTWFRRVVTDSNSPPLVDYSKPVKVIVQPFIKNNIIGNSDTICFAQNPVAFISKLAPADGNGKYTFKWKVSTDNSVYSLPANIYATEGYTPPPALKFTSWYKRIVTSGRCVDSTAIVKLEVLDSIRNNRILTPAQDICFGSTFTNLLGSTTSTSTILGGGDNLYKFRWISSINGATWGTAPGISETSDYNPGEQTPSPNVYNFRRIVFSGIHDACADTTKPILLRDYPVIVNNVIKEDQTIGFDSIPSKLVQNTGVITGGNGTYTYSWVKDTINYPLAPGPNSVTLSDYLPPNLKRTISFKRIANSSACSDISNSVKIIVDSPITNSISFTNTALDTIYADQDPGQLTGSIPSGGSGVAGDYSYKWYKSLTGGPLISEWIEIIGSNLINLSPGNLAQQFWFRRDVSSPIITPRSTYQSNKLKVTVLPKIVNYDISQSQSVCTGTRPLQLKGATLSGGDGRYRFTWQDSTSLHFWQDIPGFVKGDSADFKPPVLTSDAKYKRIVYSGKNNCGSETSRVVIMKVDALPTPVNAGRDTTLNSFDNIFHTSAAAVQVGSGEWSVVEGSGTFDDYLSNSTVIRDMTAGINKFQWKVTNGKCVGTDILAVNIVDIFVPEGFSPNNDAFNNTFIITGLDLPNQEAELKILNGAGAEVFSTFKTDNVLTWKDWDGKNSSGSDLAEGTYYYLLKITSKGNGQVFRKSGFIVLKRY